MIALKAMLLFILLIFLGSCRSEEERPADGQQSSRPFVIHVHGAYALAPLMQIWADSFCSHHPEITIEVTSIGSGLSLSLLRNGETDIAMLSGDLKSLTDTMVWLIPVIKSPVVFLVNSNNPWLGALRKRGLNAHQLKDIFTGKVKAWGDLFGQPEKDPIHCYIRTDSAGATDLVCRYLWIDKYELKGTGKNGETEIQQVLRNDPLAVSYCNFVVSIDPSSKAFRKEIAIIPLDQDFDGILDQTESFYHDVNLLQKAMWRGRYPCLLNRTLCLATLGKPSRPEILEFIRYILSEGQGLGSDLGYGELLRSENYCRLFYLENTSFK